MSASAAAKALYLRLDRLDCRPSEGDTMAYDDDKNEDFGRILEDYERR